MTCIVGIVDKDKVYIGGDSAGVDGYLVTIREDKKVFRVGEFLVGFTTSFRMGQLLQYSFNPPEHPKRISDSEYMATLFIDEVRDVLKKGGFTLNSDGKERGGVFIVGYRNKLYIVEDDFQVANPEDTYCAVGGGAPLALGSLYSTKEMEPTHRITIALEAAARYTISVREPFYIETL